MSTGGDCRRANEHLAGRAILVSAAPLALRERGASLSAADLLTSKSFTASAFQTFRRQTSDLSGPKWRTSGRSFRSSNFGIGSILRFKIERLRDSMGPYSGTYGTG